MNHGFGFLRLVVIPGILRHEYRLLQPYQLIIFPFFLIFHHYLFITICETSDQLLRSIHDAEILQGIFCDTGTSFFTIFIVGTRYLHLCLYTAIHPVKINCFQLIIRQIYRIDRLRSFQQRIHILTIFQNRLFHLIVILSQLHFFIRCTIVHIMIYVKSQDKMMQLLVFRFIYK